MTVIFHPTWRYFWEWNNYSGTTDINWDCLGKLGRWYWKWWMMLGTQMGISLQNSSREIDESPVPPTALSHCSTARAGPCGVCSHLKSRAALAGCPSLLGTCYVPGAFCGAERVKMNLLIWKMKSLPTNSAKTGHGEVHTCPSNSWELSLSIGYLSGKVHGEFSALNLDLERWCVFTKGFHLYPTLKVNCN